MANNYKMLVFHPYEHGEPDHYLTEATSGVEAVRKTLPADLNSLGDTDLIDDDLYRVIMLASEEGIHIAIIEDVIEIEEKEVKNGK